MIVADANLIVYFVWPNERSGVADEVWLKDSSWTAPPLWQSELRSAFGAHVRRGSCTIEEAVAALDRASSVVEGVDVTVSSRVVLELSKQSGCSTYDCEYVALAAALGVPLVTNDRDVLKAFPEIAVTVGRFVDGRGGR